MPRRMKKKKGEKRKREEEKEENETETVKRRCEGLSLWRPLESVVKEETWRVVVTCLGRTSWRSMRTSLIVSLILVRMCVVPDVTDVHVSPSSVVSEFCEVFSGCSEWEDVVPQSFS